MGDLLNRLFHDALFLPPQSSTVARKIDTLHYAVISGTMLGALCVGVVAMYFTIKYRATRPLAPRRGPSRAKLVEGGLAFFTLVLFLGYWRVGFGQFIELETPPDGAMTVYVSAKQWMWRFAYPEGAQSISVLYVPAGRPVKLVMTSRDVIHSFFVPDFRVKGDVVPGVTTMVWFEAIAPGVHQILCAEYCGTGHSTMRGEVVVLAPEEYAAWLAGATPPAPIVATRSDPFVVTGDSGGDDRHEQTSMVVEGERAAARYGCLRCHTLDGSRHVGPTWVGLYGAIRKFNDGTSRIADEAYLTESMMEPALHVVDGYLPVMPSYQGILAPGETAAILELIRSLAAGPIGISVPPVLAPGEALVVPASPDAGVPRPDAGATP